MKHPGTALFGTICAALLATGCNTYDTLDSTRAAGSNPDETNPHYGQPYYLPKTMLRLQIAKTKGGGGGDEKPANVNTNTNTASGNTVTVYANGEKREAAGGAPGFPNPLGQPGAPGVPGAPVAPGTSQTTKVESPAKVAYTITVTSETVPDLETGVLYVHYNQNWFYSEEVKIGVNDKNLLSTSESTSSDRTAQVIYNLADTAANVFKFTQGGFNPFASGDPTRIIPQAVSKGRKVAYKDVNVDFRFDPFNQRDLARLESIFTDDSTEDAYYVSPFRVQVNTPAKAGLHVPSKEPKGRKGLYFREPVAIQLEIVGREAKYLSVVREEKKKASGAALELLKAQEAATRSAVDHRMERVSVSAHNKERVYAYNVARSAFVQGKKQTLTIVDGGLRGVNLVKPSEAEGFSEIPLTLSNKLLALPKDILTLRQDITTKQGDILKQKANAVNEGTNLNNAMANQALAQETARLNAEKARLQAELELLKLKKEGLPAEAASE